RHAIRVVADQRLATAGVEDLHEGARVILQLPAAAVGSGDRRDLVVGIELEGRAIAPWALRRDEMSVRVVRTKELLPARPRDGDDPALVVVRRALDGSRRVFEFQYLTVFVPTIRRDVAEAILDPRLAEEIVVLQRSALVTLDAGGLDAPPLGIVGHLKP